MLSDILWSGLGPSLGAFDGMGVGSISKVGLSDGLGDWVLLLNMFGGEEPCFFKKMQLMLNSTFSWLGNRGKGSSSFVL